eukprot:106033_1
MDHHDFKQSSKLIPPSDRYELRKLEQKFRAWIGASDSHGASALVDDLYHDDVVHMMDGVPMNKAALKKLYAYTLERGTKVSVKKFQVIDRTHVEVVVHTRTSHLEFDGHTLITLR